MLSWSNLPLQGSPDLLETAVAQVLASEMQILRTNRSRLQVLRAAAFIVVARLLVRFVPLHAWRSTVGEVVPATATGSAADSSGDGETPDARVLHNSDPAKLAQARWLGRCVDRAARYLPGISRCLPRAVALHWMLRLRGIPAQTVIAFKIEDRSGADAYHAWVELNGEMVIGQCDRMVYQPIMILAQIAPFRAQA